MSKKDNDMNLREQYRQVVHQIKDNRRRLIVLDLEKAITACRLRLKSAWGQSKMHVYSFEVA